MAQSAAEAHNWDWRIQARVPRWPEGFALGLEGASSRCTGTHPRPTRNLPQLEIVESVMVVESQLEVREMRLSEVGIRINYFHDSSDDHLRMLGVDRALLPSREDWLSFYTEDY